MVMKRYKTAHSIENFYPVAINNNREKNFRVICGVVVPFAKIYLILLFEARFQFSILYNSAVQISGRGGYHFWQCKGSISKDKTFWETWSNIQRSLRECLNQ